MDANNDPRDRDAGSRYYYRRALSARELLPAVGIAIGVGLLGFYVARILAERTPLLSEVAHPQTERRRRRRRGQGSG